MGRYVPENEAQFRRIMERALQDLSAVLAEIARGPAVLTDTTRGEPVRGRVIFNVDDGLLNIGNGMDWTLPDGSTT
jgi:hypothetical protein